MTISKTHLACVYCYRDSTNEVRYIGRGMHPNRALDHTDGSRNPQLAALIATGKYTVELVGPYPTPQHAEHVEAALISSHERSGKLFNTMPGNGLKFRPFGLPPALADRQFLPLLTLAALGTKAGGVLIVRNRFGKDWANGRKRIDPFGQELTVALDNMTRSWALEPLLTHWNANPGEKPYTLVSAVGPLRHRYIHASASINRARLGKEPFDEVPLRPDKSGQLDARKLRGRRIEGARFSNIPPTMFIWVDATGTVRWFGGGMVSTPGAPT